MKFLEDLKAKLEELKLVADQVGWAATNVPKIEDCVDSFVTFDGGNLRIETCFPDPDIPEVEQKHTQISQGFSIYGRDGNSLSKEGRVKCASMLRAIADWVEREGSFPGEKN